MLDYRGWITSPVVTLSVTEKPYPVIFTLQRWFCLDREKCQEWSFLTAGWNSLTFKEFSPEVFVISLQFSLPPKTCLKIKQGVTCALSTSCGVNSEASIVYQVPGDWEWVPDHCPQDWLSIALGHRSYSLKFRKAVSSITIKESWNKTQHDSLSVNSSHFPKTKKLRNGLGVFDSFLKNRIWEHPWYPEFIAMVIILRCKDKAKWWKLFSVQFLKNLLIMHYAWIWGLLW